MRELISLPIVKTLTPLLLSLIVWCAEAQIKPPGNVRVPDDEKPSKPFIWSERRLPTAPELFDAPDEWIDRSLQWVNYILETYAPSVVEHPLRHAALIRLDDVLHIESAPRKELVQKFFRERMERVIVEIEKTRVTEGVRVWKLYNHGFLVRTPSVSFTFDVVPGIRGPGFSVPKELMERLAAQTDATFISHLHGDHANPEFAQMMLDRNKPVIAPEGLWKDRPEFAGRLTYPERSATKVHPITVRGGAQTLKVIAFPGHQGPTVVNNVHLVSTPEGFTVVQTGDQWGDDVPGSDFDWLSQISRNHRVDILFPNVWTKGLDRIVRGINPNVVITGHENEMAHTVDHREDYTQTYNRMLGIPYPLVVMTWGETWMYRVPGAR
jgi:L-ascorbate metabolism protein UlaG (beta-lactamase superfamily)